MLQQTQVSRVLQKYKEFLKAFPTARVLAKAPLSDVLKAWSGLGYNRRAKYLHDTAKIILKNKGNFNEPVGQLKLPGVGPYTRAAVRVFAFNEPHTMIETNIRTVFIHHFFADKKTVSDKEILEIAKAAMPEGSPPAGGPRSWHWALMDYGAYLKQSGIRNNQKSAHYTKQSKFKGSLREVRGAILRQLHADRQPDTLHFPKKRLQSALAGLARDGLIVKEKGNWRIV